MRRRNNALLLKPVKDGGSAECTLPVHVRLVSTLSRPKQILNQLYPCSVRSFSSRRPATLGRCWFPLRRPSSPRSKGSPKGYSRPRREASGRSITSRRDATEFVVDALTVSAVLSAVSRFFIARKTFDDVYRLPVQASFFPKAWCIHS